MNEEAPPVDPVAAEIHRNFLRKMRDGGEIDRILKGGVAPPPPRPAVSDDEVALIKRQIETQLAEYEESLVGAVNYWKDWKSRQPKGFRRARR